MILHEPFKISARLLPALEINGTWISWDGSDFIIDLDGKEYVIDEYRPGACHSIQSCFGDICSFLSEAGEAVMWAKRGGSDPFADKDSMANLFPREVSIWASTCYDDLSSYCMDFEEQPNLIEE